MDDILIFLWGFCLGSILAMGIFICYQKDVREIKYVVISENQMVKQRPE